MHTPITKPYVNRVTFREQNLSIFEILPVSSTETMLTRGTISFQRDTVGQRAANLHAVKVGGLKKNMSLGQSRTTGVQPWFESLTM